MSERATRTSGGVATVLGVLLLSTATFGQAQPPRWDVGGGGGPVIVQVSEVTDGQRREFTGNTEFRADLGRYWTPHLKVGLAVGAAPPLESHEAAWVVVGGVRQYAGMSVAARLTTIAPSITYQFLDNAFMHPYVTAGVRVGVLHTHRTRASTLYSDRGGPSVDVPSLDERRTVLDARPFAAAGFKSYINRQMFVRTEALTALGPGGTRVMLHLGLGVDF